MTEKRNKNDELSGDHPSQIGSYKILDILGEGGMSIVYLAEQTEPVKRQVALKIIKLGMDSKQVVARFESERQALAVLDHPNIAKVFDGGIEESGRSYFVMERVHGIPITDYCDNHRLDTNARIRVFIDVCSAVQHAHHKGLIHRDLKPSNILVGVVDGNPQAKIIDFGIAKATSTTFTDKTLFTKIGQIVGTPQYMSPEQADITGLDVDTRTDIYSLGVVFYELLVGALPLDLTGVSDQAIKVALQERDPSRPSTRITELGDTKDEIAKARNTNWSELRRQLSGDIDWIIMRAMAKDRTRRYETANALAMECRRFLKHEPVLARPPSAGYLLSRFVKRNRLIVVAGTIAILAVIAGAAVATLGYVRATEAKLVARQEAETASQVSDFLIDLFEVSDPSESRGNSITAREILDRGTASIHEDLAGQPEIQATLMQTMGQVYQSLGLYNDAEPLMMSSLEIRQSHPETSAADIAESLDNLGVLKRYQGDFEGSEDLLRKACVIYRAEFGVHANTARCLDHLGNALYEQNHYEDAAALFGEALAMQIATVGRLNSESAAMNTSLGALNWSMGRNDESEVYLREALSIQRELHEGPHPDTAQSLNNLALLLKTRGETAASEPLYREAMEMFREVVGEKHPEYANTLNNLAQLLAGIHRDEEALDMQRRSYEIYKQLLGDEHPQVLIIKSNVAKLYATVGDLETSERLQRECLVTRQRLFPDGHRDVANSHQSLAEVLNRRERYAEAEPHAREAVRLYIQLIGPDYWRVGAARSVLGASVAGQQRFEEAEPMLVESCALVQKARGDSSRIAQLCLERIVDLYEDWGKPEDAAGYRP